MADATQKIPEFHPLGRHAPDEAVLNVIRDAGDQPLMSLAGDLDAEGKFGRRWLVLGRDNVWVLPDGAGSPLNKCGTGASPVRATAGGGCATPLRFPCGSIEELKVEGRVGGALIFRVAKRSEIVGAPLDKPEREPGDEAEIMRITNSLLGPFSSFTRAVNRYLQEGEVILPELPVRAFCERCGRMLPEENTPCPKCVRRFWTFRRVLACAAPYRWGFRTVILLILAGTALQLALPMLTRWLIDSVISPGEGSGRNHGLLVAGVAAMFVIGGVATVCQTFSRLALVKISANVMGDIRARVFHAIELQRLKFFDRHPVGDLISRVSRDTDRLNEFLTEGLPYITVNVLTIAGVTALLFYMNWRMALFLFVPLPLLLFGSGVFWRRLRPVMLKWHADWSRMSAHLSESFSGMRVIKAFGREEKEFDRFRDINADVVGSQVRADRLWAAFQPLTEFSIRLSTCLVWLVGGWLILNPGGQVKLGTLIAFIQYFMMVLFPMQWFAAVSNWSTRALAGAERIFEVLDSTPEAYDRPDAVPLPRIRGDIEFRNVYFGYEKAKDVLKGVSLKIEAEEVVGLVGKSGVGKTTTINLVCRFYEADRGEILLDGIPINDVRLADLRGQIGMVLQEPFLFNASILENIRYSKPQAAFEEVVAAARMAEAHEFIVGKPDGYHTLVGERGSKLSSGERQRVSIARAILHDPRILILDEPTSSVDTETEKKIQMAINRLVHGRTTIAIAHRLATLRNADRLIVFDDGKVAEMGSHDELIGNGGIYQKLVETQTELSHITAVGG